MESFLKNRPVHVPSAEASLEAAAAETASSAAVADVPFAPIQRTPSGVAAHAPVASHVAAAPAGPDSMPADAAGANCESGAASVQAITERGRVTRLVVTCSCGKVTEIACTY